MFKKILSFSFLILLGQAFPVFPQPGVAAADNVTKEKENFIRVLSTISNDPSIVSSLTRYFDVTIDRIHESIRKKRKLSLLEREKAERSLVFFIKEMTRNAGRERSCIYDIPGSVVTYEAILSALLNKNPVTALLENSDANRTQLMAATFSQYKEHALLEDIAVYKRVASSPEYILQFLENRPSFRFADSLLVDAVAYDPARVIYYLKKGRPGVTQKFRSTTNIYLKQIATLSDDKLAPVLVPFLVQVTENRIAPEEIIMKRAEVMSYFQLLVNTLQEAKERGSPASIYQQPLRKGLQQKAKSFYVNEINDLHDAADPVRFASVKQLRPEDIYYIITNGGDELYTSSYLGLYKRLMQHFNGGYADSLFTIVGYDNFHDFIRLAANYNVLSDLLSRLSPEKKTEVIRQFIEGIENDPETALNRAMDIGDSFSALHNDTATRELIEAELQMNMERCRVRQQFLGVRLYGILSDMLAMLKQEDGMKRLWTTLGDYELLKKETLKGGNEAISQLVLFYGDEDGVASFTNFLRHYTGDKKWEISKNEKWVSIRSLSGEPVTIYANRPLDIKEEKDLHAQDSLASYLKERSIEPTVLIHRGHSYHLDKTLKRLTPSVRLAILGSCGSYNRSISIASINPDVQVIGSKKMGSKSINDPIIETINETLLAGKDLYWPELWKTLTKRFAKEGNGSLFSEYFPPSHNLGLFVLKLFNHYCSGK